MWKFPSQKCVWSFSFILIVFVTHSSLIYCHQYELRLAASDNLKENYTTVVIHVKDVNE